MVIVFGAAIALGGACFDPDTTTADAGADATSLGSSTTSDSPDSPLTSSGAAGSSAGSTTTGEDSSDSSGDGGSYCLARFGDAVFGTSCFG